MKEFKLYVGLNPGHMIQVLHASLRGDAVPKTFTITHVDRDGVSFHPTTFVSQGVASHRLVSIGVQGTRAELSHIHLVYWCRGNHGAVIR